MSQSGEKTEAATPKKKRDAREKGQVRKSIELNTAFMVAGSFAMLMLMGGSMSQTIMDTLTGFLSTEIYGEFTAQDAGALMFQTVIQFALIMAPVLLFAFIGALVINYLQVGFLYTTKTLAPKFERISPLQGFKRIFSIRTLVDLVKSILKIAVLGVIIYGEIEPNIDSYAAMINLSIQQSIVLMADMVLAMAFKVSIALLGIAVLDYLYQWWQFERDLRMTKQEIKDENKLLEGDPQIKSRIRQKQRQMGMMRMMQSVPEADVVITNPTHYAVALRYDDKRESAPIVLAKGVDYSALMIKRVAAEHNIEIVEDRPLAQALYAYCEVGDLIPADMYKVVAEVLAYVYRLKHGQQRPANNRSVNDRTTKSVREG